MDLTGLLNSAYYGTDANTRNEANRQLSEFAASSYPEYMVYLAEVLVNESVKPEIRMLSALGIKNQLTAKDPRTRVQQQERWVLLGADAKQKVKESSIKTLLSDDERMVTTVSQLVSSIALYELPQNAWEDLIPTIIEHTKAENPVAVKRACLLTIGYICESADANDPAILAQSNGILIAIVQGIQGTEPSTRVRLTALNALINSLQFIKNNFAREGERNFIMQVVCEASQVDDSDLQAAAFACLTKIVAMYYRFMPAYMEKALYVLTISGMESEDQNVACMAIEFWSTVCEEEFELAYTQHDYAERGEQPPPEVQNYNFALFATKDVLPVLLKLLKKQNEDPEDDDWSVAMAAGSCLQLFATTTGMYVVNPTLQFFAENIGLTEWRDREAAIMAFGSILDGQDIEHLKEPIQQAMNPILHLLGDPTLQVKETAAWCLGKITEVALNAINQSTELPPLLEGFLHGLKDHPKVSVNCCWALMNILEQLCKDAPTQQSSLMSIYYQMFVPALVELTDKSDNEFNSRASAYEALSAFVSYSAYDTMPVIHSIASEVLSRLEATIGMQQQANTTEARAMLEELQINILSLLTSIIRRLSNEVSSAADNLMTLLLKLLGAQEPNALIEEDICIAISAVASAVGTDFMKYMESFLPFLTKALHNVESPTCNTAVGLVADLAQSLGPGITTYLDGLMDILGRDLSNDNAKRDLKPAILSCFGDIAGVVEEGFMPYMDVVMNVCTQLANTVPEDNLFDTLDYIANLKEAVLDCYVGIVSSLNKKPELLFNYLSPIFQLLQQIAGDVELSTTESAARSAVGLLGDIAAMYPDGHLRDVYSQEWITLFIKRTRSNTGYSSLTKDAARWARDRQKRQIA